MSRVIFIFLLPFQLALCFTACSSNSNGKPSNKASGTSGMSGVSSPPGGSSNSGLLGPSCTGTDPNHLCLAVKYVVYKDSAGQSVLNESNVQSDIDGINRVWNQCNVGFQVEKYLAVDPSKDRLDYLPANESDLTDIRNAYMEDTTLLVVTTGTWNRNGTLGDSSANAWTSMPGESPYGAILEKPVGTFANIIAHELGHYLGLLHVVDAGDLMNPIIYNDSDYLTTDQCAIARREVGSFWQRMIR